MPLLKALVLHAPGDLRLEELPDPTPPPGYVLLRVERAGICGTDKAFYKGTYRPGKLPIVLGHEVSGRVVDVGAGVSKDLLGLRVTTEINLYCGKCWYCRSGMPTHCPYRQTIGITVDGGMAEYMVTRSDVVHSVEGLSPAEAAFVEPLAAVVEMVRLAPPPVSGNIAVVGIGTIGLLSIRLISRLYAPSLLVAVAPPDSPKKELALRSGADVVASPEEALEIARKHTPEGAGFDYVVEATGSPQGFKLAEELVRPRGVIAVKSTHGEPVQVNITMLVVKEVQVSTSRCGPFRDAINLLKKGAVRVSDLVTSEYPLERGVEAFKKSFDRREVKIHIVP
ncbi:MAG: alcohol dehydrogenase catalytic domain-containing protein [Desulfurococcaceae archaeon]